MDDYQHGREHQALDARMAELETRLIESIGTAIATLRAEQAERLAALESYVAEARAAAETAVVAAEAAEAAAEDAAETAPLEEPDEAPVVPPSAEPEPETPPERRHFLHRKLGGDD